jgi:hypothetical protein
MGSVLVQAALLPSAEWIDTGSFPLKLARLPALPPPKNVDANTVAAEWVASFNKAIHTVEFADIPNLFLAESYWRDQLCLSWDFHCMDGPEKVVSQLKKSKGGSRVTSFALDKSSALRAPTATVLDLAGKVHTIQAFLTVEMDVGKGAGVVRLVQDQGTWKAFTLFTFLSQLEGYEESVGRRRPNGVEHGEHASRKNWLDRRNDEESFEGGLEPTVLILGKPSLHFDL